MIAIQTENMEKNTLQDGEKNLPLNFRKNELELELKR